MLTLEASLVEKTHTCSVCGHVHDMISKTHTPHDENHRIYGYSLKITLHPCVEDTLIVQMIVILIYS